MKKKLPPPPDEAAPNIPIIGEPPPSSVVMWYPTSIIHCRCAPGRVSLLVVTGFGNHSQCGNCKKLYSNSALKLSADGRSAEMVVDVIIPAPPTAVQ